MFFSSPLSVLLALRLIDISFSFSRPESSSLFPFIMKFNRSKGISTFAFVALLSLTSLFKFLKNSIEIDSIDLKEPEPLQVGQTS